MRCVTLPAILSCLAALSGSSGGVEPARYTGSPDEYARQFDLMIEKRDRSEDYRLKRDPGPRMLGEKQIAGMLLLLKSKHWQAREFGCSVLGRLRAKVAVDVLIGMLGDENERTRDRAAEALGRIGDRKAIGPLLARLDHPAEKRGKRGSSARGKMAMALGLLGDKRAVRPLLAALRDESEHVKLGAAYGLGKLGEPSAGKEILPLLSGRSFELVRVAVVALGEVKCVAAVDGITPFLGHKDGRMRFCAARALGQIGDRRALPGLKKMMTEDKHRRNRAEAARALGKLGDRSVVPALRAQLGERSHGLAAAAAKSLYDLGDPQGLKALREMFGKRSEYSHYHPTSDALAEMGQKAVPIVMEGLVDPKNRRLRENAAVAVKVIGASCADRVLALLGDARPYVRHAAARALHHRPDQRALRPLIALLGEDKEGVNRAAAEALGSIGRAAVPELIGVAKSNRMPALLHAIGAMGRIRDRRLVPVLVALLRHGDAIVRQAAVSALVDQPHKDALPAVITRLKDGEDSVRICVLDRLSRRSWAAAYAREVSPLLRDKSVHIRRRAAGVLRTFCVSSVLPELQACLKGEKDERTTGAVERAIEQIRKVEERRKKEAERKAKHEADRKRREEEDRKRREEEDRKRQERERNKPEPKPKPEPGDEEPL